MVHDQMFGLKDYTVDLSYWYYGNEDVIGLCFECDGEFNMSKGYGHCYVPDEYWVRDHCQVAYCQPCYRIRCRNKVNFTQKEEFEKLRIKMEDYKTKTTNGKLT